MQPPQDPVYEDMSWHRPLTNLTALVEEKTVPIFDAAKRDLTAQNVYQIQGMEHTDERSITLLTASSPQQSNLT